MATKPVFSPNPAIIIAAEDLRFLLNRGYNRDRALQLVAERHQFTKIERLLLYRGVYADAISEAIISKRLDAKLLENASVHIDGYNVLITVETGLKNEPLILGDDGTLRDLAGRYSSYTPTDFTENALHLIFTALAAIHPYHVHMLFDRPISQSGELALKCRYFLTTHNLNGICETSRTVDSDLMRESGVICSSDSVILRAAQSVFDLPFYILAPLNIKMLKLKHMTPHYPTKCSHP